MLSIHGLSDYFQNTVGKNGQSVKDTVEQSLLAVEGKISDEVLKQEEICHPFVALMAL
jgi:hypothetical protein